MYSNLSKNMLASIFSLVFLSLVLNANVVLVGVYDAVFLGSRPLGGYPQSLGILDLLEGLSELLAVAPEFLACLSYPLADWNKALRIG